MTNTPAHTLETAMLTRLAMRIDLSVLATLALCSALAAAPTMTSAHAPAVKSVAPRVGVMSFDELVRFSDAIVVARVIAVHEVLRADPTGEVLADPHAEFERTRKSAWAIAEAEVLRRIKGERGTTRVWFVAEPTWTCDISTANTGETVLLFLSESGLPARETEWFARALAALTRGTPLHAVMHSGYGRMPVFMRADREYVRPDVFKLPKTGPQLPETRPALLADVETFAARWAEQQGPELRAVESLRAGRIDVLDVRVWHDGYRAWSSGDRRGAAFVVATEFEPTRAAFSAADAIAWNAAGARATQPSSRAVLTLVKDGERREVVLPPLDDPNVVLDSASAAAVRLWLALTEPLELQRENDPRAGYRALLARGR
jgi:hypothetical protein